MKRAAKIALLTKMVNGQAGPQDLKQLRDQKRDAWFMVVTDSGSPEPTDLVDTRLPDEHGRRRVSYAEFLNNPVAYGNFCIIADQQP